MARQRKAVVPIAALRTRKRVPKQTKDIQRAIMDVILNKIETEKECRISAASSFISERESSNGVMDAVIKRHKKLIPGLTVMY
jgi:hypothetical protein